MASKDSSPIAWHDFALRTDDTRQPVEGLGGRVLDRVRQVFCGLHGHDTLLQFEKERMFLRCVSCGHQSPGWELNEAPPVASDRADDQHRPVARPHLISARRTA